MDRGCPLRNAGGSLREDRKLGVRLSRRQPGAWAACTHHNTASAMHIVTCLVSRQALFPLIRAAMRYALLLTIVSALVASSLAGQGRGRQVRQSTRGWWLAGGASATSLSNVADGASRSQWAFGSDPLWQMRASLEKELDIFTTLGADVSYGRVDVSLTPLSPGMPVGGIASTVCPGGCTAETELWTAMATFRSGGGFGFHRVFEAQGGATVFRNLRTRDRRQPIPGAKTQSDLTLLLGGGFGFTMSSGFEFNLVQDFGIGWHERAEPPQETGRSWRVRTTRASLRFRM